jgi:hypothetical protein
MLNKVFDDPREREVTGTEKMPERNSSRPINRIKGFYPVNPVDPC